MSGDKSNMYNNIGQPLHSDGSPDPTGPAREAIFSWLRRRRPHLLPVARTCLAAPHFLRLVRSDGALRLLTAAVSPPDTADAILALPPPDPSDPSYARSCCGVSQGRSLSTTLAIGTYHDLCQDLQLRHRDVLILADADDTILHHPSSAASAYAAYADMCDSQRRALGLFETPSKVVVYSPSGDLSPIPEHIPGSPSHPDGRILTFKAVGTYFGDPTAAAAALDRRLCTKLAPLDAVDCITDTETLTNTSQLRYKILQHAVLPILSYTAAVTPPTIANAPLANARNRIRRSFELIAGAESSPPPLRDNAWAQACLPTCAGGLGLDNVTPSTAWAHSTLQCWPAIAAATPLLADPSSSSPYLDSAVTLYEGLRRDRHLVADTHTSLDATHYHTVRGGYLSRFHPRTPPLPLAETLPPASEILDGTSTFTTSRLGSLAAIETHRDWLSLHSTLTATDTSLAALPAADRPIGCSAAPYREASRLVSTSTPYADGWLRADPDGTAATFIPSDAFRFALQRRCGLYISDFEATATSLLQRDVACDKLGDYTDGRSNHNRRHGGALRGWYDAISAVVDTPVILGDKGTPEATAHLNRGHVIDIGEPGGGPGGTDRLTEIKIASPLQMRHAAGVGSSVNGGTPASVGHLYAFGNTEERLRLANLGCRARGHPSMPPLDHHTGRGWVRAQRGCYYDAFVCKRSIVDLTLHESLGGGFSPPAVARLHSLSRAARAGQDTAPATPTAAASPTSPTTPSASL